MSKLFYDFHCGSDVLAGFEEVVQVEVLVNKFSAMAIVLSIVFCTGSQYVKLCKVGEQLASKTNRVYSKNSGSSAPQR